MLKELALSVMVRRAVVPQPPVTVLRRRVRTVGTVVGTAFGQYLTEDPKQPLRMIRRLFLHADYPPPTVRYAHTRLQITSG